MIVDIQIPDITAYPNGFPQHWLKVIFISTVSTSYQFNALSSTYVRLTEAAFVEYRLGRPKLHEFWNTHLDRPRGNAPSHRAPGPG